MSLKHLYGTRSIKRDRKGKNKMRRSPKKDERRENIPGQNRWKETKRQIEENVAGKYRGRSQKTRCSRVEMTEDSKE